MSFSALTDIGRVRKENQDSFLCYAEKSLYAVADGMGGYSGGAIASKLATSTLREHFFRIKSNQFEKEIKGFYELICNRIGEVGAENPQLQGMGTTLLTLMTSKESINIANVGDSRAFLYHKKKLKPLNEEQNLAGELVRQGKITAEDALTHKGKYILTSALNKDKSYKIDFYNYSWKNGDIVLLCSDGLCGFVPQKEIEAIISNNNDMNKAAEALINSALNYGGEDNITVVLVKNSF